MQPGVSARRIRCTCRSCTGSEHYRDFCLLEWFLQFSLRSPSSLACPRDPILRGLLFQRSFWHFGGKKGGSNSCGRITEKREIGASSPAVSLFPVLAPSSPFQDSLDPLLRREKAFSSSLPESSKPRREWPRPQ